MFAAISFHTTATTHWHQLIKAMKITVHAAKSLFGAQVIVHDTGLNLFFIKSWYGSIVLTTLVYMYSFFLGSVRVTISKA